MSKLKRVKRKHRWATAKGKVIGVRLSDREYEVTERRAENRGMSISKYIKWLIAMTRDEDGKLDIEFWLLEEWQS